MPVPKRKRSRARRDKRFANKGLEIKAFAMCANCEEPIMPHQACPHCGHYKGVKVMETKLDRAVKRGKVREARAARQQATQPQDQASEAPAEQK